MSNEIPIRQILNHQESQKLMAADEVYIKQMTELTVELNGLAEKAGKLMREYITVYQKITAPARLRPKEAAE